jgi:CRP/FNR family cyclic AMP-dependent transcriptional regulator
MTPNLSTRPIDIIKDHPAFPLWLRTRESFTSRLDELFPQEPGAAGSPPSSPGGGALESPGGVAPGLHRGLPGAVLDLVSAAVVPRAARSQGNVHKLYRFLLEQPFFMDYERSKVELIATAVGHAYFPAGSTVILQGDLGDTFYMIVHGAAAVHVAGVGVVDNLKEPYSFGDLALTSDIPRSATVTATTDLHTLTVDRDTFLEVMRGWQEKQNEMVADFLGKQPTFASWSRTRLARLCARVQVRTMREGETLAWQGRACSHIAVVKRGALHIRHATETTTENRWPASNGTVEAALASAARCGLLDKGGGDGRHVRIEEPGEKKEGGGGEGGGDKGAPAGVPAGDGSDAKKAPQSAARALALAAAATGLPLLPVPAKAPPPGGGAGGSPAGARTGATARSGGGGGSSSSNPGSPALRDRGWGAGLPGGTLAFSPRAAAVSPAAAKPPPAHEPYFIDTSRPLPTSVRHAVKTSVRTVGSAGPGALMCVQQCFRKEPSPFTLVAAETGTQIFLVSARYLSLVGSEEEVRRVKTDADGAGGGEGDHAALTVDGPAAYAQRMLESLGMRLFPEARTAVVSEIMVDAALSAKARAAAAGAAKGGTLAAAAATAGNSAEAVSAPGAARTAARARVDAVNARGDPAELLELLPFGAGMVSKVLWSLVAKLVEEMDTHAATTLEANHLSPLPKADAPVAAPPAPAGDTSFGNV